MTTTQRNMDTTQRPVAVYGTLRDGEGNWSWAIQPYGAVSRKATIRDHAMYPMPGFPFVIPQKGASIVVDIFDFAPEDWNNALSDLDQLEGYRGEGASNLYNRRVVTAHTEDGEKVEVYVYLAANEERVRTQYEYLPSGDWKKYKAGDMSVPKVSIIGRIRNALRAVFQR